MSRYLIEAGFTSDSFAALVKSPHDRIEQIGPVVASLDGSIETAYFAFGESDLILIVELPDNVSAAALSMAASASGGIRRHRTTPLLTMAESLRAMEKASGIKYRPPSDYVPDWG
jgi:uncharacterized protein with GYD domain